MKSTQAGKFTQDNFFIILISIINVPNLKVTFHYYLRVLKESCTPIYQKYLTFWNNKTN